MWVFGWPDQKIIVDGHDHVWSVELKAEPAWVDEIIYPIKVHRLSDFPGFRIRTNPGVHLEHGMSGGPVLYNGRLVGIFTGPDLVACLWPLALMVYPDANDVEHSFAGHLDSGLIDASFDWEEVRDRAERVPCEDAVRGTDIEACDRKHIVLSERQHR